ncbi:MAG: S-layer homology domain-containing protein [Clostridia bacterium]|nr:S-layer homology domain-containing protein [Clostridia bacterium]
MKKLLSLSISLLMLLSVFVVPAGAGYIESDTWYPDGAAWEPLEKGDDVLARFAIGADSHFGGGQYRPAEKLRAVFDALAAVGGVDMFGIAGDVTDDGSENSYRQVMGIVREYTKELTVENDYAGTATGSAVGTTLLSMGNHEYHTGDSYIPRFEAETGQKACGLYMISGVPVIKMSPGDENDSGNYHVIEDFVLEAFREIDESGYKGIIIGMAHHRPGSEADETWSEAELAAFSAHPNFILFTGHSHTFFYNPSEFINQDNGYTIIRSGVLGHFWGGSQSPINPETGRVGDPLTDNIENSCGLCLVDVMKDGTAKIRRMDVSKGEYVFPDDEIVVDPGNLIYKTTTEEGTFGAASRAPSFPDGAELSVTYEDNHDTIVVHFPSAIPASDGMVDYIWRYRIRVIDPDGEYIQGIVLNDSQLKEQRSEWHVPITGLKPDVDYTVRVIAMTGYRVNSPRLELTGVNVGHVETKYPAEPILGFDASVGTAERYGHAKTEEPARLKIQDVAATGGKAANFLGLGGIGYSFGEDDFARIRFGFTLEAYFCANDTEYPQFVAGGQDSASCGLRVEGGTLRLWGCFRSIDAGQVSARMIAETPIEAKKWYHAVAVYDGAKVDLYLNGELVDSGAVSGGLDAPDFGDPAFYVGAFSSSGSDIRYPFSGQVALVRLYEGAMKAEDVKNAYSSVTAKRASDVFADVVRGAYYEEPVTWAVVNGITAGTGKTTFSPEDGCTRGQVVTFLWRAAGEPEPTASTNPFRDVKSGDYFYKAVLWAVENGVTQGTGGNTFSPDDYCTRGQIVTFLWRSAGEPEPTARSNPFRDVDGGDYFYKAVLWAVEKGITLGTGERTFSPGDTCTRAQIVTFLYRNK